MKGTQHVTSHQSPVTSHQSPVTSHQSPVTSHQSPVTSHQSRLDSVSVLVVRWPPKFREFLEEKEVRYFAELRELLPKWYASGEYPPGFSPTVQRLLACRFSIEIYCTTCGAPMMLYRDSQLCEDHGPGCERIKPLTPGSLLHKAFPDRIVK